MTYNKENVYSIKNKNYGPAYKKVKDYYILSKSRGTHEHDKQRNENLF